ANKPAIIDAMRRPAESTLTWKQYRPIFLDNKRIVRGAAFIERYQSIFDDVERQYGVPAHVIAAIIGVETRYGRITGKYRVLDALATLAFDYIPRAEFFTSELTHFVRLCLEENLDCRTERGSYAGAMGWPQFMPSSYRNYAVDFNDNGSRDLWNEPGDIIASVANYLARNGWRDGERVALPATVSDGAALAAVPRSRISAKTDWEALRAAGIHIDHAPSAATAAGLLEYAGAEGTEYWVGLPNFFVITTYNHSPLYAMAVHQLSQAIAARHGAAAGQ